jgi:phosphoglycolate phosphatase
MIVNKRMIVCLFDIDGTLVSTGGAGKAALEAALLEVFNLPGLRGTVAYSGRTDAAICNDLLRLHDLPATPANRQALHEGYLARLPAALQTRPGRILPGIADLLALLDERDDVRAGLLTGNIRRGAAIKLEHFDLLRYFPFGGFGDDTADRNAVARAALAATAAHLGRPPPLENVWVIGDTPLDVACARAIGARCLAVATGLHPAAELAAHRPDLLMDTLAEYDGFLRLLN